MQSEEDKLWDTFSKYIRLRDADEYGICKCITCRKPLHWKQVHAGHFMSRRHKVTKFNEKNNHAQCVSCNTFHNGEQFQYGLQIDILYGEGTAEELMVLSRHICKLTEQDYKEMNAEYKLKLKQYKSLL